MTFVIIDSRCYFDSEFSAEGLFFGNSVYWIRFDEEFSEKVCFLVVVTCFDFHILVIFKAETCLFLNTSFLS